MKRIVLVLLLAIGQSAWSQEEWTEVDREPASIPNQSGKRTYPGGNDEEDLRVLTNLPEAPVKTDARSIQKEVFRALYNQELKDDRPETVEE